MNPLEQDPVFAEPWEAQAFAMVVKLHEKGVFTWNEWAETLGATIKAHPHAPYYESWLAALESLVEAKGVMTESERLRRVDNWERAARLMPQGQPIELSRSGRAPGTY